MLWDCVNEISGKRNKKAEIDKIKIESGEEISNKNDIAQKFLEHLTSIGEKAERDTTHCSYQTSK
ncbi:unnamed protein product [Acanthoscelides obtectus]|uniref:Uncharacterized protein n=1 Tax=Acanthoscelides obtectus TaxID=200917 RepID=A0A9P0QEH5_ACAOB|nr:unnamed protein product [Acanthoscelides obtectus]CAH2019531.1 unnamed protein product [Acanthoscelides obtectus]CAK1686909.1 hypothetical protein AOBTE_LOCUS36142 [Acanthoscelides obtectus]CAK1689309.1 hypothetical protein AOBTE_LOCUS37158 [Acanthoscelides obtectus]